MHPSPRQRDGRQNSLVARSATRLAKPPRGDSRFRSASIEHCERLCARQCIDYEARGFGLKSKIQDLTIGVRGVERAFRFRFRFRFRLNGGGDFHFCFRFRLSDGDFHFRLPRRRLAGVRCSSGACWILSCNSRIGR